MSAATIAFDAALWIAFLAILWAVGTGHGFGGDE